MDAIIASKKKQIVSPQSLHILLIVLRELVHLFDQFHIFCNYFYIVVVYVESVVREYLIFIFRIIHFFYSDYE
jgi:hypothetical protein